MHAIKNNFARQQGMATLVVSMVLLLAITLMIFSSAKIGVSEQRSASNDVRAKEAIAVAEAAIDNALLYLEANKTFVNNASSSSGWLYTGAGAAKWQACSSSDSAPPCGNGTANVYPSLIAGNWERYSNVTNMTPLSSTYTAAVHYVTPNLGTAASPVVSDYPTIHIIADVKSATVNGADVDPLAGRTQVKQTVQGFSLLNTNPDSVMMAGGNVGLSGSFKIWGNPTGLHTMIASSSTATNPPAADYIKVIGNLINPDGLSSVSNWADEGGDSLDEDDISDNDNTTYAKTSSLPASFDTSFSQDTNYDGKTIASITISVRAKSAADEYLDWGPVINGNPYLSGSPVTLTTAWTDYQKFWATNPVTNAAWTETEIDGLVARISATVNGAASEVDVAKECVMVDYGPYANNTDYIVNCIITPYTYEARYTVPTITGKLTRVDRGSPVTVRDRATASFSGSAQTCRNWSDPTLPSSATAPYTDWYPGTSNPNCRENTNPPEALSTAHNNLVYSDVVSNDTSIPSDMFQYVFSVQSAEYSTVKNKAVILPNCSSLTTASTGIFWITGNCNINHNIGSPSSPPLIVVEGDLDAGSSPTFYGLIFLFHVPGTTLGTVHVTGNVTVIGALISDHAIDFGSGSCTGVYSRSVLEKAGNASGTFAKIPGGWLDKL